MEHASPWYLVLPITTAAHQYDRLWVRHCAQHPPRPDGGVWLCQPPYSCQLDACCEATATEHAHWWATHDGTRYRLVAPIEEEKY